MKYESAKMGSYYPIRKKEIIAKLSDDERELNQFIQELDYLVNGLYERYSVIQSCQDENMLAKLTPIQRDRFSNNFANIAMELMTLAELIDEEEAKNYKYHFH